MNNIIKKLLLLFTIIVVGMFVGYLYLSSKAFVWRDKFAEDTSYFDPGTVPGVLGTIEGTDYCTFVSEEEVSKAVGENVVSRSKSTEKLCIYSNFSNKTKELIVIVVRVESRKSKADALDYVALWQSATRGSGEELDSNLNSADVALWSKEFSQLVFTKNEKLVLLSTVVPNVSKSLDVSVEIGQHIVNRL